MNKNMEYRFKLSRLDHYNLAGERVYLQPIKVNDAKEVYEAIKFSLDALREFPATMPWALEQPSIEKSIIFCSFMRKQYKNNHEVVFTIRLNSTNELIGLIGLKNIKWAIPRGEIGIWGNLYFSKKGYMAEGLKILIDFLKNELKFNRIEALVDQMNINSKRLFEKSGFKLEGVMRNALKNPVNNELRNLCIYSIIEKMDHES